MKRSNIALLRELLVTQMNYWSIFPFALTAHILTMGTSKPVLPFVAVFVILSLLPMYYCLVRRHVNNLPGFLILHILPGVPVYFFAFTGNVVTWVVSLVFVGIFMIYSLYIRIWCDEWEDDPLPVIFPMVIFGGCMFLQNFLEVNQWRYIYYALLIVTLSLYSVIVYIEKYFRFLTVNESSASHIPEQEIFHSGLRLVLMFTGCAAVILLLVSDITWLRRILGAFKSGLVMLLKFVLRFINLEQTEEVLEPEMDLSDLDMASSQTLIADTGEGFWLWDLLVYAICAVIAGLMLYAMLKILGQVLGYLRARLAFRASDLEEDEIEETFDERERLYTDRKRNKSNFKFFTFFSNTEKVRRLYKKQAQRLNTDASKLRRITARECAGYMKTPDMGNVYEKARYSGEECTAEDLRKMKIACRRAEVPDRIS